MQTERPQTIKKLGEHAPGNVASVIKKMLLALSGQSDEWRLNPDSDVSNSYTERNFFDLVGLRQSSPVEQDQIINNLLGIGILRKGDPKILDFTTIKEAGTYFVDIKKLKDFKKNSTST